MAGTKSDPRTKTKLFSYENFQGLDSSRDIRSMDIGEELPLVVLDGAYCDWRGQIVRDSGAVRGVGQLPVTHIRFITSSKVMYVERSAKAQNLVSELNSKVPAGTDGDGNTIYGDTIILRDAFPQDAVVTSTMFNNVAHFASSGRQVIMFDGNNFRVNQSAFINEALPAYCAAVQRRFIVAGIAGRETQIHFSRVDDSEVFADDEDANEEAVTRGAYVDIANLLGIAGNITGLGAFEQDRLAVFTPNVTVIFRVDPDLTNLAIDDRANINIGCISHNTIQRAGTDLLFCSRSGIHSIKRSEENGILVYSYSMSDRIDLLYRELVASVKNPEEISAVYDQDLAQYHVFFPQGGDACKRLTFSLNPENGEAQAKFSTSTFLNARCGASLAGRLVVGTPGGLYDIKKPEYDDGTAIYPDIEVVTPFLWHGSLTSDKQTTSMIIQASGKGFIDVTAMDELGRELGFHRVEVEETDTGYTTGVTLAREYEFRWPYRYRTAQYRFRVTEGSGLFRFIGFAINVSTV